MIENYNEQAVLYIIDYMRSKGLNNNGIAGLLGNIYAESRLYPNNLQNKYNKIFNLTDEEYTEAVDTGTYTKFDTDAAGYGLCQWTREGRKTGYHNYAKSKNLSVGDLSVGTEYIYIELSQAYKSVLTELISPNNTVRSCAEIVVLKYEVPGSVLDPSTRQATLDKRTQYAQDFYDKYLSEPTPSKFSIPQIFLTNNDCYKDGWAMIPQGIVVHSTGCNNPSIKRYVQPDDGIIGLNSNGNDWNHPGIEKCVSAFVGKDKNGNVTGRQTLPWNMCTWGCGRGKVGSYNYPATKTHPNDKPFIQFEMCEDDLTNEDYFNKVMDYATDLCAYLCKTFSLPLNNIVSHKEAAAQGMASSHSDPENWLSKFGKDMNWFRKIVKDKMDGVTPTPEPTPVPPTPTPTPEPTPTPLPEPIPSSEIEKAKSYDANLNRSYTTTTALNLRVGAGMTKKKELTMPKGTVVRCYGYYTTVLGIKWLLVQTTINGLKYTGYCSSMYLK